MANPNPPTAVSVEIIEGYAASLKQASELFEDLAKKMKNLDIPQVVALNYPSGVAGFKKVLAFANAAQTAFLTQITNDPSIQIVREKGRKYEAEAALIEENAKKAIKSKRKPAK